ncbi:MAG: discoidin domain-containing protein [Anaerolineae bacterium]|nr:discoidin domain-containing protein [Anaerolineae bacterium]
MNAVVPAPKTSSPLAPPKVTGDDPATISPLPTPTSLSTAEPTLTPAATPVATLPLVVQVDATVDAGALDTSRMLNVAAGGYAPMANVNWLPGIYDELSRIGMEMVRVDHLLDEAFYSVVWRGSGDLNYDFSRLDRVVVPILQHGMQPLMCLSYKPEALDPRGQAKAPPIDLDEWSEVVRTFVEHYAGLGYTGLIWEVWNEPDHAFFFQGSPEQYVALYAATARAVKDIDPTAQVGGAADSSVTSPGGKLRPLLAHVAANPVVPLDFVSYHDYSDPDGDGRAPYTLSWNVEAIEAMVTEAGLAPREIFVTEWNLTPNMTTGPGAPPDTHAGAAAVAVKLYDLLEHPSIRRAFYFAPMDGYTPRQIFNGDLGLLTVNGHRKATYNLFEMVSRLGDHRLAATVTGDNTGDHASYALATRDEAGQIAVLIWNAWENARTVDLSVAGLPEDRPLVVTRSVIDATRGNYYHDYSQGLRGYSVGPSEPLVPIVEGPVAAGDGFFARYALPPHSVVLVEVTPGDDTHGAMTAPSVRAAPDNYAATKPVTASSSHPGSEWETDRLVDEITHSLPETLGWSSDVRSTADQTEWVQVDLGAVTVIDTVRLYPRDDLWHEGAGFPVDFTIQGAVNPDTWIDLVTAVGYDPHEPARQVQTFAFAPGSYRYIRVLATRLGAVDDGEYALQFAEMEVGAQEAATP